MNFSVENIRCFSGKYDIPIKPLTILLGENSSGKTTLLASFSAVSDSIGFPFKPSFNKQPFSLGSFNSIVTDKGEKFGKSKYFSLGLSFDYRDEENPKLKSKTVLKAIYVEKYGQSELSRLAIITPKSFIKL
ncbi:MAG: AAA family ATPase [Bacteroidales bacterium]|nr:AAA family ATPase [Bacteroidales bacterium]